MRFPVMPVTFDKQLLQFLIGTILHLSENGYAVPLASDLLHCQA